MGGPLDVLVPVKITRPGGGRLWVRRQHVLSTKARRVWQGRLPVTHRYCWICLVLQTKRL